MGYLQRRTGNLRRNKCPPEGLKPQSGGEARRGQSDGDACELPTGVRVMGTPMGCPMGEGVRLTGMLLDCPLGEGISVTGTPMGCLLGSGHRGHPWAAHWLPAGGGDQGDRDARGLPAGGGGQGNRDAPGLPAGAGGQEDGDTRGLTTGVRVTGTPVGCLLGEGSRGRRRPWSLSIFLHEQTSPKHLPKAAFTDF